MAQSVVALSQEVQRRWVGGKAANLSKLIRLGMRVPECVCVVASTAKHPGAVIVDLTTWVPENLPSRSGWAVRSSAPCEDGAIASHAGQFETIIVSHPGDLDTAVQRVRDSAGRGGLQPDEMGVIIQRFVEPDAAGVVMSSDPVTGVRGAVVEYTRGRGEGVVSGTVTPWRYRRGERAAADSVCPTTVLEVICRAAESVAAEVGYPADLEWALAEGELYWLQLRPMTGQRQRRQLRVPEAQVRELAGTWMLMEHCLLPVAPLIAGLDPGGYFDGPAWTSQVVSGFHYICQKRRGAGTPGLDRDDGVGAKWARIEASFGPRLDELLAATLSSLSGSELWNELQARIELNRELFRQYFDPGFFGTRREAVKGLRAQLESGDGSSASIEGELASLLSGLQTRTSRKQRLVRELAELFRRHPNVAAGGGGETLEAPVADAWSLLWSSVMDEFGFEAPNTELFYLPTLRETPELLLQSIRAAAARTGVASSAPPWTATAERMRAALDANGREAFDQQLRLARECMRRTEDDDYLLQKGAAAVRYSIIEAGGRGVDAGALEEVFDVFFLSVEELRAALLDGEWPHSREDILHRRAVFDDAKDTSPAPIIIDGKPIFDAPADAAGVLQGQAASWGRSSGAAFVIANPLSPPSAMPPGSVVVTPMLTPALAYTLTGCAAIVTEVGGLASHGAIVARELGIPAVVGASGATSALRSGVMTTVDGFTGQVYWEHGS